jgi:hypothetical protein
MRVIIVRMLQGRNFLGSGGKEFEARFIKKKNPGRNRDDF